MLRLILLFLALFLSACSSQNHKRLEPGEYSATEDADALKKVLEEQRKAHLHILTESNGIVIDGLTQTPSRGPFRDFDEVLPLLAKEPRRDFMSITFGKSYLHSNPPINAAARYFSEQGWQRVLFLAERSWGVVVLRDLHAGDPVGP